MRRLDKELKKLNRNLKGLEDCICIPLCKEEGIIPENGNGCRYKISCKYHGYHFINHYDKILFIQKQKSYLEEQRYRLASC